MAEESKPKNLSGFIDKPKELAKNWYDLRYRYVRGRVLPPNKIERIEAFINGSLASVFERGRRTMNNALASKNTGCNRSITLWHDAIEYKWEDVPEKKYNNWYNMTHQPFDISDFYANSYPYLLQIEPTNFCNLACPLCPAGRNELGRERRNMTLEEFKSVIDDVEDYLLFLVMWDFGEPLMNPDLPDMIRYASQRGIKTVTSTNGHYFEDEIYLSNLLQSGLTTLIVAIDSIHEESYQTYRKKGSLSKAMNGLKKLIDLKNKLNSPTAINMRMVVMKHNESEIDEIRETAKQLGVDIFTVKTVNPGYGPTANDEESVPVDPDLRRYEYIEGTYQRVRVDAICNYVWTMSNIHSDGSVVACCYDYDSELKVGNIQEQKFTELWNGQTYRELRKKIYFNKESLIKCKDCNVNFKLARNGWFVDSYGWMK